MSGVPAETVCRKLADAFGPLPRVDGRDPVDVLIQTILSQNTTDVNSDRAFARLKEAFPEWDAARRAAPADLVACIRVGGLAEIKAERIVRVLDEIRRREGDIRIDRLADVPRAEAMAYLLSLDGVGVKTANCVVLFGLGMPAFPVDTHVYRITRRLGWLDPHVPFDRATAALEPLVPEAIRLPLHLYLIRHGRRTCRARGPLCPACCIRRHCRAWRTGVFP